MGLLFLRLGHTGFPARCQRSSLRKHRLPRLDARVRHACGFALILPCAGWVVPCNPLGSPAVQTRTRVLPVTG